MIDLIQKARDLGITDVRFKRLSDGLSGFTANANGKQVIVVNSSHPRARQRFTLAHELAHVELGHTTEEMHRGPGLHGIQERKCDRHAVKMVMPEDGINEVVDLAQPTVSDVFTVADTFDVSPTASAIRLVELSKTRLAAVNWLRDDTSSPVSQWSYDWGVRRNARGRLLPRGYRLTRQSSVCLAFDETAEVGEFEDLGLLSLHHNPWIESRGYRSGENRRVISLIHFDRPQYKGLAPKL